MNEFLNTMRKRITEWNERTARSQKIRIAAVALFALALVIAVFVYFGRVEYAVLFSGMDAAEAGTVYDKLTEMNVPVQTRNSGTILVPADMVSSLSMQLAAQGYPQSGVVFDEADASLGFGATDEDKKQAAISRQQIRLRNTIKAQKKIKEAYVTIVPADESKYALSGTGSNPARATVFLEMQPGQELTEEEALTIGRLVKNSIRGLEMSEITLADTEGREYDMKANNSGKLAVNQLEMQKEVREDLKKIIDDFLSSMFGDAFSTVLSVKLNFDKKYTEETTYSAPNEGRNEGITISKEVTSEKINDGTAGGAVGTTPNTGTNTYPATDGTGNAQYDRSSEKFNYEVNSMTERVEGEYGNIEDVSLSAVIDSETFPDADVAAVKDALITALSAASINVTDSKISVMQAPLVKQEDQLASMIARQQEYDRQQQTNDLIRIAIIAAAIVIVILIMLLMLRTLMNARKLEMQAAEEAAAIAAGYDGVPAMEGAVHYEGETEGLDFMPEVADNGDRARIEAFIEKDAESVARLLRNWLAD